MHVDSHTGTDLEWGSWLMRQKAQAREDLEALTPSPAPKDAIKGPEHPGPGGSAPRLNTLAKSIVSPHKGLKFVLGG